MLSYHFLFNDTIPWKNTAAPIPEFLQKGKDHLLKGEFKRALICFDLVGQNASLHSEIRDWGHLLGYYTYLMQTQFSAGALKPSNIKPFQKLISNPTLSEKELKDYEKIRACLRQFIIMQSEEGKPLSFSELHEYAWRNYYAEELLFIIKNIPETRKVVATIEEDLKKIPNNHYYYYLKFYLIQYEKMNLTLESLQQAEEILSEAIRVCPKSIHASPVLAHYYWWRGKIRMSQNSITKEKSKRLEMLSDFQNVLNCDNREESDYSLNTHFSRIKIILSIYTTPKGINEKNKNEIETISDEINNAAQDGKYFIENFINRAKMYEKIKDIEFAALDYSFSIWILKMNPENAATKNVQKELEDRRSNLLSVKEEKSVTPSSDEIPTKKKKKNRNPKHHTIEQPEKNTEEVFQQLKEQEAKLAEQAEKQDQIDKKIAKKQIRKMVINFIHQAVDQSEHQKKLLEYSSIKATLNQQMREKKAKQKALRLQRFMHRLVLTIVNKSIASKEPTQIIEEKNTPTEEEYTEQETIPFRAIAQIIAPSIAVAVGQAIKALPGRISKRVHLYGGTARKALGIGSHDTLDYDLRTGKLLSDVAPLLKSIMHLSSEPKEKHGILSTKFLIKKYNSTQIATLTVSHSPHLAREDLSYSEASRLDAETQDFVQNGCIATIPKNGLLCNVHYPLNWWNFYFGNTLQDALNHMKQHWATTHLSETLIKLALPAFLLVLEDNIVKVYFYVNGKVETLDSGLKLSFDLKLKESDRELLMKHEEGRLPITRDNQHFFMNLIHQINEQYQNCRHQTIHNLTRGITEKIARIKKMETILEPVYSLAIDPLRLLRLSYLTTSLRYQGFSQGMLSATMQTQELYKKYLLDNPGKINSWMNKLFCREGKLYLLENFDYLRDLGLLQLSFPFLKESLGNKMINQWLMKELQKTQKLAHPSLDYLYCVIIQCIAIHTKKTHDDIIQANPLFKEKFKTISFNKLAEINWEQFKSYSYHPHVVSSRQDNPLATKSHLQAIGLRMFSHKIHNRRVVAPQSELAETPELMQASDLKIS